ncbi:MAG: response regulator transcription factor [Treponema bryantii]|nr:response regulator transcription factor [Treponema bryantii]
MKKVLIIDSHPLFREFLKQKLYDDQIEVVLSQVGRDAYTRTISILPNLIILDMSEDRLDEMEFLEKKAADINTSRIPIIVIGPDIDKTNIAALAKYGVIKYFAKPIQFDIFFEAIGEVLHNQLSLDTTPCVLDLHRNGNIIFIEIAQGLNREKIALLQYKLSELIEREEIDSPKIVIMLTNLELTFVDGYNLEFLIENVIACPKIHNKNVKILSLSSFVQAFLDGHPAYSGIEMSNNLPKVLNSLVDTTITSSVSDLITEKIITPSNMAEEDFSSVETRFYADASTESAKKDDGSVLSIAIIDEMPQFLEQTAEAFTSISAKVTKYSSGVEFLNDYSPEKFNLIILDVTISDSSGFTILHRLRNQYDAPPVIVYSQSLQKEFVIKVLSSGAKSYLVKPQKTETLLQKSLDVLKGD